MYAVYTRNRKYQVIFLLFTSGSKDETPEVRAAKQEMSVALKTRRTELEDRLYDKVQELKKLCLGEAVGFINSFLITYILNLCVFIFGKYLSFFTP